MQNALITRGVMFFLFLSQVVYAQSVSGVVTDLGTGQPIAGVSIECVGTDVQTVSDTAGIFNISPPEGTRHLNFYKPGFAHQSVRLGAAAQVNVALAAQADVAVGYGTLPAAAVSGAIQVLTRDDFNQGLIQHPWQLIQGRVAGLQIYNREGDPNGAYVLRLRGLATVSDAGGPLVVVDGVIGASIDNVDPDDIEKITILKDGSAAAIYGTRANAGLIIVDTSADRNAAVPLRLAYQGRVGVSTAHEGVRVMDAETFIAAGGFDLGATTDWQREVLQQGIGQSHSLGLFGNVGPSTDYQLSGHYRDMEGVLKNAGFRQSNIRMHITTRPLNDRLTLGASGAYSSRYSDFSFPEAFNYAVTRNPTSPILGQDANMPFPSEQYGGYFEHIGLFNSFNPLSILNQSRNVGKRSLLNLNANLGLKLNQQLSLHTLAAVQHDHTQYHQFYPGTALYRGGANSPIRKGRADFSEARGYSSLVEVFAAYMGRIGRIGTKVQVGYARQQAKASVETMVLRDFSNSGVDIGDGFGIPTGIPLGLMNPAVAAYYLEQPNDRKLSGFFARTQLALDKGLFVNASVRQDNPPWLKEKSFLPAVGLAIDLKHYLRMGSWHQFKVRVGYGVTGALPGPNGLSQEIRSVVTGPDGSVSTALVRAANPDLTREKKAELNFGVEMAMGRFNATLDLYNRDISDFISETAVDASVFGVDRRFENAGRLNTKGVELTLGYDVIQSNKANWSTSWVVSSYKTVLEEYINDGEVRGVLGAPGQNGTRMIRVAPDQEIGQIWGPVFAGVAENGTPLFQDLNGDGVIIAAADKALDPNADFQVLGNGIPDLELGWNNQLTFGDWSVNAFFRGAFGHSLVNTFRAFYEPVISTQSSYNYVNTDLRVPGLTSAQYSSLYVEKAGFLKLDNVSVSREFALGQMPKSPTLTVHLSGQNLFIWTRYTGVNPEPSLVDYGATANGFPTSYANPDVFSPGIDRPNTLPPARTICFGATLAW